MPSKQVFFLVLLVACLLNKGINGEYICQVDGLEYSVVRNEIPKSLDQDDCNGNANSVVPTCGYGDMCQSYIGCKCTDKDGDYPPGERCWTAGKKLTTADGKCNRAIANRTAITRFDASGRLLPTYCGAFMGCKDDDTILVFTQGCEASLRTVEINSKDTKFLMYYGIEEADLQIRIPPNDAFDCVDGVVPGQVNGCSVKLTGSVLCPIMSR